MKITRFLALTGALTAAFTALSSAAFAQKLTTTQFADGSGSIGVAPGWKMTSSAKGAVDLAGPNGAQVDLGIPTSVVTRGVERFFPDVPVVFPGAIRADFSDPVRAMIDVINSTGPKVGVRLTKIRAVEYVPSDTGKAAYVRYAATVNGKPYEVFGMYAIMPVDNVQGIFYFSVVTAPAAEFNKQFHTMMAMWKSWSISGGLIKERMDSAAKALGEVDVVGTLDSVNRERRAAGERAAAEFNKYIRQ